VALNDALVELLEQHFRATTFNAPADWICLSSDGSHLIPMSLTRFFTKLTRKIGI
jgi:hypothetical protein